MGVVCLLVWKEGKIHYLLYHPDTYGVVDKDTFEKEDMRLSMLSRGCRLFGRVGWVLEENEEVGLDGCR